MRIKVIVEFTMDHMPDEKECEEICKEQGVDKSGFDAVKYLALDTIREEGLLGVTDENRILDVLPIVQAKTF